MQTETAYSVNLNNSVQEILADTALQLFQNSIVRMNSCPAEEQQKTSELDSGRLGSSSNDLCHCYVGA
uniref:Uncharacterized protein n=1 Tax=Arundo donax TaxID=35708 RepID=A0A0A9BLS6_ARUDO